MKAFPILIPGRPEYGPSLFPSLNQWGIKALFWEI
jgi:hypothetical protein